jgi:hypothetical protein
MVEELERDVEAEGAPGEGELGVGKVKAATADTQKRLEVRAPIPCTPSPSTPYLHPLLRPISPLFPPPPHTFLPSLRSRSVISAYCSATRCLGQRRRFEIESHASSMRWIPTWTPSSSTCVTTPPDSL